MLEAYVIRQCRIRFDGRRESIYTARRMFVSTRNSRIGLALFAVYLIFYGAFVLKMCKKVQGVVNGNTQHNGTGA